MVNKTSIVISCAVSLLWVSTNAIAQRRFEKTEVVKSFDKNGDGWLNSEERNSARQSLSNQQGSTRGRFGRGGIGMYGGLQTTIVPGPKLSPADVKSYSEDMSLYDIRALRTIFLDFENDNWEAELEAFYRTDVEVPVKMIVDGKTYEDVGVRFRGNGSYRATNRGQQRPLNLSIDFINKKKRLYGYKTLNLLTSNSITTNSDPTLTRQVLFSHIARQYIPAFKANYIRLVINGENWGIYTNYQQFDTIFINEEFNMREGARWKIPVNLSSSAGLMYLGEDVESYKRVYEIKSQDNPDSWAALIKLCRVLNQTPLAKLEEALKPLLDINGTLRFLAVENALINNGGYWARGSDCVLYLDANGRFHIIPYDTNESMNVIDYRVAFRNNINIDEGVDLNPLAKVGDSQKPLISRLLAVPSLRQRYLGYIRDIAKNWLTWDKISPLARQYQALIAEDVKYNPHQIDTTEAFLNGLTYDSVDSSSASSRSRLTMGRMSQGTRISLSLKSFVEQRRTYLLNYQ
jgi:hypothetical protein